MRSFGIMSAVLVLMVLVAVSTAVAEVPQLINYQGQLTDGSGNPENGSFDITFGIYDAETNGSLIWSETQSVSVAEGLFSVLLGSVTELVDTVFNDSTRWLGIKVGTDLEMPRTQLVTVPYAFRSASWTVEDDVLYTGGGWGIARAGNTLYGDSAHTHVNLGVACTTGTSGQNRDYCTVGGGMWNTASGENSTVGGGETNTASGDSSTVAGGSNNTASGGCSTVGGGLEDTASGFASTVGGGWGHTASGDFSTVGGGTINEASEINSTVGGGELNTASGGYSTVAGGVDNTASGHVSTVGGGYNNEAGGNHATVSGGLSNTAGGGYSFAAGRKAKANHDGAFVWADSTNEDFASTGPNQFLIRADGGVGIGTNSPSEALEVAGKVYSTSGGFKFPDGTTQTTAATGGADDGDWTIVGNDMYSAVSGNVGIGMSTAPYYKLYVNTGAGDDTVAIYAAYESNGNWGQLGSLGSGVWGFSGSGVGVYGRSNSGFGVYGRSSSGYAGYFVGDVVMEDKVGIGTNSPSYQLQVESDVSDPVLYSKYVGTGTVDAYAVYGKSAPQDYYGFGGVFVGGYAGVYGAVSPTGGSAYVGVQGSVSGGSGTNYGVYGSASNGATNWAGYFNGNCRVTGTFTNPKSMSIIDHPLDPENKYLYHSSVQSPDMKNVYDGVVTLDGNGNAVVGLPDYFEALNDDFRYQLTCIGGFAPVYIADKISGGRFGIAGGQPGMEVSWQVTGVRTDAFAKANPMQVEVDKSANELGRFLHPEAFGLSEDMDIHYEMRLKDKGHAEGSRQ